jgi:hypothetical protein
MAIPESGDRWRYPHILVWWLLPVATGLLWLALAAMGVEVGDTPLVLALAVFTVLAGPLCLLDASLYLRKALLRRIAGHRFLCPECLRFGPFRWACGRCGEEAPPDVVHWGMAWTCGCPVLHNGRGLLPDGLDPTMQAFCPECRSSMDLARYHHRRVRVLGVFSAEALGAFQAAVEAASPGVDGQICVCDDGARLTYILPLHDLTADARGLSDTHAVRHLEAIWLDVADPEPLALGGLLDRFVNRSGLTEEQRRRITVCVPQAELPAVVTRLLSARFGRVRYEITPGDLLDQASRGRRAAFLRNSRLDIPESPPLPEPTEESVLSPEILDTISRTILSGSFASGVPRRRRTRKPSR